MESVFFEIKSSYFDCQFVALIKKENANNIRIDIVESESNPMLNSLEIDTLTDSTMIQAAAILEQNEHPKITKAEFKKQYQKLLSEHEKMINNF